MELSQIIPINDTENWKVSKKFIFRKKLGWIPILKIDEDALFVFLDLRIAREVIKVIKSLIKLDIKFILISPLFSNIKNQNTNQEDKNAINMEHLLLSYSKVAFYDGFKKIGFDILKNLSEYCEKYSCYYLLEDICHNVNEKVQDSYFDYYAKKDIYDTRLDIRNKFRKIYREIQLSNIL